MCSGSTPHVINGEDVILKQGELLILNQNAVQEIYPAGEGAGYAGGITSAAIDGVKVAEAISRKFINWHYFTLNICK